VLLLLLSLAAEEDPEDEKSGERETGE